MKTLITALTLLAATTVSSAADLMTMKAMTEAIEDRTSGCKYQYKVFGADAGDSKYCSRLDKDMDTVMKKIIPWIKANKQHEKELMPSLTRTLADLTYINQY